MVVRTKMVSEIAQDIRAKVYAQCEDEELSLKELKAKVKKVKPRTSLREYIPELRDKYTNEQVLYALKSKRRDFFLAVNI